MATLDKKIETSVKKIKSNFFSFQTIQDELLEIFKTLFQNSSVNVFLRDPITGTILSSISTLDSWMVPKEELEWCTTHID